MAQHSCCKRADCQTSINAGLSLIFQASGNDEDDQCMGVGIVATRPISQGEQVFISYSGDTKIEDTWGKIFRSYCCQCQRSCVVRNGRSLKRTVPIAHQNTMTPQSGLPPKKSRNEMYRPEKRKRDDQRAPDLEPPDKKRSPPVPQDTLGGLRKACRSEKQDGEVLEVARGATAKDQLQETLVEDRDRPRQEYEYGRD